MYNGIFLFANEVHAFSKAYSFSYHSLLELQEGNLGRKKIAISNEMRETIIYQIHVMGHISLYELWEYQIKRLLRLVSKNRYKEIKSINDFENKMKEFNIEINISKDFPKLNELRLICNSLKHGEGKAERDLKLIKSSIFLNKANVVFSPMIAKHLDITWNSYIEYLNEIERFWLAIEKL